MVSAIFICVLAVSFNLNGWIIRDSLIAASFDTSSVKDSHFFPRILTKRIETKRLMEMMTWMPAISVDDKPDSFISSKKPKRLRQKGQMISTLVTTERLLAKELI